MQNISTGPLKLDYKTLAALPTTSLQKINRVRGFFPLCCCRKSFSLNLSSCCLLRSTWGAVKVVYSCSSFWKCPSWPRISPRGIPCFNVLGAYHPRWAVGPPGAGMLTFCVCNPEHDTAGGDLRPCYKFWIGGKQKYNNGSVEKFGKRSTKPAVGKDRGTW